MVIENLSTHITFDSKQWSDLRANTPLTLGQNDLATLVGFNDQITLEEVSDIYLPMSRLLNLYVAASQELYRTSDTFLGQLPAKVPFVIGIAGSVAVGKTTTARILQSLLSRWPNHPRVDLVTTDGFLYPNALLEQKNLMERKGFPESYDKRALIKFLHDVKSGNPEVSAPVYSHLTYDVIADQEVIVRQPDVLIVEGLTVLQTSSVPSYGPQVFVSDFFDFSIYLDAEIVDLRQWYIERFLALKETAFVDKESYFNKYSQLPQDQAISIATSIWTTINEKNLVENILPTRDRADLILTKKSDHKVNQVKLRRL